MLQKLTLGEKCGPNFTWNIMCSFICVASDHLIQVEDNRKGLLGLTLRWTRQLNRGDCLIKRKFGTLTIDLLIQGDCLIWFYLIQVQLYAEANFALKVFSFPSAQAKWTWGNWTKKSLWWPQKDQSCASKPWNLCMEFSRYPAIITLLLQG